MNLSENMVKKQESCRYHREGAELLYNRFSESASLPGSNYLPVVSLGGCSEKTLHKLKFASWKWAAK